MKKLTRLFARDSKGRIKVWQCEVNDFGAFSKIVTKSGILCMKLAGRTNVVESGKNIGKSNETTIFGQACNDMESKWRSKVMSGYKTAIEFGVIECNHSDVTLYEELNRVMPINNTDKNGFLQPMKAQQYYKTSSIGIKTPRIKFPCLVQPKINGVRCFAVWSNERVKLLSKKGLEYTKVPHIIKELENLFTYIMTTYNRSDIILDGELYIHNTILSDIRKAILTPNMFSGSIVFKVFDVAVVDIKQLSRTNLLDKIFNDFPMTLSRVQQVKGTICESDVVAQLTTDDYINQGYEGTIFRDLSALYKFGGRPVTMTKLKRRESEEFLVLDVVPMKNRQDLGMFVCKNNINNHTFTVVVEGDENQKKEYLENKENYIGKELTVEYYERTKAPKELPFHSVGIIIRDYE